MSNVFNSNSSNKIDDKVAKERDLSLRICTDINRILMAALRPSVAHLNEVELDVEPRHEAFWFVGGIDAPTLLQKMRKGIDRWKDRSAESVDRPFQYTGKYLLSLP